MPITNISDMNKFDFEDPNKSAARCVVALLDKYISELEKENETLKRMNAALQEQIINIQNGKTQNE